MKKYMISFFTLLFITIIMVCFFIILINKDKKAQQEYEDALANRVVTKAPTEAVTPTIIPEPTAAPVVTELYPAFQIVDNIAKYGYINKTGQFVIEPSFDTASDFHDGVAVVSMYGENYIIDEKGSIINTSNDVIFDFCNNAAIYMVKSGNKDLYGYIDINGRIMIDARYEAATDFNQENTAYVKTGDNEYALIDRSGNVLESYTLDKKLKSSQPPIDGYLILAKAKGVVNMKGEVLLEPKCSGIRYLGYGLFAVKEPVTKSHPSREAIFNDKGQQLTEYSYYDIGVYQNGYACATDDTSTFFLDITGNKAVDLPEFNGIGTLELSGDVIKADIEYQLIYCTTNKSIFWQEDNSIALSDNVTISRMIYRPNRFEQIQYPHLEGLADEAVQESLNLELQRIFVNDFKVTTVENGSEEDIKFHAALVNNLLMIGNYEGDATSGTAGAAPTLIYNLFIDIKTGIFYQFKDLFLEGSDYVTKINGMISDEIKADSSLTGPAYTFGGISDSPVFSLDKTTLAIYLIPGNITSFNGVIPKFLIPFIDIEEFINKDGSMWHSLQGIE